MKLISMTDFVLLKTSQGKTTGNIFTPEYKLECIENYANFLKQPLTLGMFVPCDENGNPLPEPQMRPERNSFDEEDMDYDAQELYEYIQAKEKVLFKGFTKNESELFNNELQLSIYLDTYEFMQHCENGYGGGSFSGQNLENLAMCDLQIELTPSALKQIGLNP
ncbi:hypothetical protein [Chryseobacterium balustinum]|uniref:hypothetical protein n=1 Tax=Chryseobacterium balustinum TaxID=246 RepID=UPI003CF99EB5